MKSFLTRSLLLTTLLLLASCNIPISENSGSPMQPVGVSLLKSDEFTQFTDYIGGGSKAMVKEVVSADNADFEKAFRIEIVEKPKLQWDNSILTGNAGAVKKGDIVFVSFYVRTIASQSGDGQGTIRASLGEPMPSFLNLGDVTVRPGKDWQQGRFGFKSNYNYTAGEFNLTFMMGQQAQTLEIGGIQFVNCGNEVELADLDLSDNAIIHEGLRKTTTYEGRDKDAKWRKDALERIERIRKGELTVIVKDAAGNAIKDANVEIKQTKHKFWLGNEIRALTILNDKTYLDTRKISLEDAEKYRNKVKELFNVAAFGQAMVWWYWDEHGKESTKQVAEEFLKPNGIALRGIPLVWSGRQEWKNPKGTVDLPADELKKRIDDHVIDILTVHKGNAVMWDVLNEPISEPDFINKLGRAEAVEWFKLVRRMEPEAKLYANDYGLLDSREKLVKFVELIRYLKDNGAPIDGVSPQSHLFVNGSLPSMKSLKESFDLLGSLGLEVYPDQFEAVIRDENVHADFTRDFYITAFSHPSVVGVTHWGFWAGEMWMTDASWYRKDWSEKPFSKVFTDLFYNKWWTKTDGQTNEDGEFTTRGFLGDYEITITANGQRKTITLDLTKERHKFEVTLNQ